MLIRSFLILYIASMGAFAANCKISIKDITGKDVCIPPKIKKIAVTCYGGASQEIALFMGGDAIVAQPSVDRFQQFLKVYPDLKDIKSAGTFNDVNLEYLSKLDPDIVFAGITSSATNNRIEEMNIPVFTLGIGKHNIHTLLEEFSHVGKILKKEQKAKELVRYWQTKINLVETRLSNIKPSKRKKVFYTSGSGGLSSENKHGWGNEFIRASGGINVASELKIKGSVSAETLLAWDPDIIITSTNKTPHSPTSDIAKNIAFKNLTAVKNKTVYNAPIGTFWWDRPSPESILGILWLSKILYPEVMKDIDLKQEAKSFYKKFYNYALSDNEYEDFFFNKHK